MRTLFCSFTIVQIEPTPLVLCQTQASEQDLQQPAQKETREAEEQREEQTEAEQQRLEEGRQSQKGRQ
jgi:hypothetical protein